jgi:hypothetical protein
MIELYNLIFILIQSKPDTRTQIKNTTHKQTHQRTTMATQPQKDMIQQYSFEA